MAGPQNSDWQSALLLVPAFLAAINDSVEPALLVAGAVVSLFMVSRNPVLSKGAAALGVGALSGPGLELPVAWIALAVAALGAARPGRGRRWLGVVPALLGLVWSLTWGMDPGLWPIACGLAALSVGITGVDHRGAFLPVLLLLAGIGGTRAIRVVQLLDEGEAPELPGMARDFGAPWVAADVERRLLESGDFDAGMSTRERSLWLAERGGARLALRLLGGGSLPSWERAALLNQAGRVVPALVLTKAYGVEGARTGPGVVWQSESMEDRLVVPLVLSRPAEEVTLRASSLGGASVDLQVAGLRLAGIDVSEADGVWVLPVALGIGPHRLTLDRRGADLERLQVEVR